MGEKIHLAINKEQKEEIFTEVSESSDSAEK